MPAHSTSTAGEHRPENGQPKGHRAALILSQKTHEERRDAPIAPEVWTLGDGTPELRPHEECAWRRDVALEMWVDVTADLVTVRLQGVLDASTGRNVSHVILECMADGRRDLALDVGGLRIDPSGRDVLRHLRVQVQRAGGRLLLGLDATS